MATGTSPVKVMRDIIQGDIVIAMFTAWLCLCILDANCVRMKMSITEMATAWTIVFVISGSSVTKSTDS